MRFITEFEQDNTAWDQNPAIKGCRQLKAEEKLGHLISASFGFAERGETTLAPDTPVLHKHQLEIEAFPMDKWIEFKRDLFAFLELDSLQYKTLLDKITELESFGKPAEDAITNPS